MNIIKLGSILILIWLVGTLHVLSSRGLFFDEAIYFVAGKTLVWRGENWQFETWFVGSPFVYPVLVGAILKILQYFEVAGLAVGIAIVREINVIMMVATAFLVYKLTLEIFENKRIAMWATALFGSAGSVIFTGGFATYDTLALLLTTCSLWLAIKATKAKRWKSSGVWVILSGFSFAAAFITKYIVIAFVPAMLAVILASSWEWPKEGRLRKALALSSVWLIVTGIVGGAYVLRFWEAMQMVFLYNGGHTMTYGATEEAILVETLWFLAILWVLGTIGSLLCQLPKSLTAVVLLGASTITAVYHIIYSDPLALFKQMAWGAMFLAPLAAVAMEWLYQKKKVFTGAVMVAVILIGLVQVGTLQKFYPDPDPVIAWLQSEVTPQDDPILVDDVWAYRYALNEKFDKREWYVVDQWWWQNKLATPELWADLINQRTFSYIVFEKDGAFKGSFATPKTIETLTTSGSYQLVASFPSEVTWGNAILPPPFKGELKSYSTVTTEIWKRTMDLRK